jgi:hypothetical protein
METAKVNLIFNATINSLYESGKRTRTASGREDVAGMAYRFNEMNRTQYLLQINKVKRHFCSIKKDGIVIESTVNSKE